MLLGDIGIPSYMETSPDQQADARECDFELINLHLWSNGWRRHDGGHFMPGIAGKSMGLNL
jgi:hypothetical protein